MQYVECPAGYYNDNCSDVCPAPLYGLLCAQKCDCVPCHHVYGCSLTLFIEGKTLSVRIKDVTIRMMLVLFFYQDYYFMITVSTNSKFCLQVFTFM